MQCVRRVKRLNFKYEIKSGKMYVTLSGEMDHHSAKTLRNSIDSLIDYYTPDVMYLDSASITFCDSSGLGFLMGRYKKLNTYGGNLIICNPSCSVKKILNLTGMDKLLKLTTSEGDSL